VFISRRAVLAAGMAVAVTGTIAVWSRVTADAAQIPQPAVVSTPPPTLPWGAKPAPMTLAAAGASSLTVARAGADGAMAPAPRAVRAPKGAPPPAAAAATAVTKAATTSLTYFYSKARQGVASAGSYASITIAQPKVATGDYHSLAEIAVESADQHQVVEVGWNVDPGVNGDSSAHLFVYHWVDGAESCYNGCGFEPYGSTVKPGGVLPVGVTKQFGIEHYNGAWWIAYDSAWIGSFPDSLWSGAYVSSGLTQWFGEVAAGSATPCSQMGNGIAASSTTAATFTSIGFFAGPTVGIAVSSDAAYSAAQLSTTSFRFGGPGAC
jgi:hypothetical protein